MNQMSAARSVIPFPLTLTQTATKSPKAQVRKSKPAPTSPEPKIEKPRRTLHRLDRADHPFRTYLLCKNDGTRLTVFPFLFTWYELSAVARAVYKAEDFQGEYRTGYSFLSVKDAKKYFKLDSKPVKLSDENRGEFLRAITTEARALTTAAYASYTISGLGSRTGGRTTSVDLPKVRTRKGRD